MRRQITADTSEDKTDSFLLSHNTYAADIFGGSRPFATDAYRTSGGLRYSTVQNSAAAFKYGVGSSAATTSFDTSIYVYGGASSLIFTGTSLPRRAAQDPEGLYFALPLTGNSYDLKTSFTVHYDDTVKIGMPDTVHYFPGDPIILNMVPTTIKRNNER